MLLKANKYRKDKKADCRQNGLGSRIFVGKVFGNYAEYLHLYPSFSYGRIIAERNEFAAIPFHSHHSKAPFKNPIDQVSHSTTNTTFATVAFVTACDSGVTIAA